MELDSGAYIQTDSKSFTLSFTVLPGPVQGIEINVAALAFPQNHQFRAKCPKAVCGALGGFVKSHSAGKVNPLLR